MLCTHNKYIYACCCKLHVAYINYIFKFMCQGRKYTTAQTTNKTKDLRLHRYRTNKLARDVYVNLDNGIGSEQGMHINNSLTTNCMKFFMNKSA